MELIKHYVEMTPDQMDSAAEAVAVIIVAHIKANRKRAAEAKRAVPENITNEETALKDPKE